MTDLIADMPLDERPRERLLAHGTQTLSNAELLALVIGTGTRGRSAMSLARELLNEGVWRLGRRDVADLKRVRGVGTAKATRIAAAFELSRRTAQEEDDEPVRYSSKAFAAHLLEKHQHPQEHVGVALLDSHSLIITQKTIFVGTINSAFVSPRDIASFALMNHAVGVVLYHNHPSGNPNPSVPDLAFTRKLREALSLFDIDLVDHVIVGKKSYYSLDERMKRDAR